ncbi:PQQ-dependent sugar dehydrogenase [Caenispirillum bisanense]|uniref:Glucose/arabinose dehydrogenase, beta-propeller fold n=1 Tax=Caenispirillum bisanense TaxID=414052 RepID=A0A286GZS6_9PROT|nr:PQQ-dependent sugar dehydrogenase [Caenispirillum bisanense]SOE01001.1 Glucose/arabinose dehydrogenase, beta-propeller fold [Caenispirillum bisanense]
MPRSTLAACAAAAILASGPAAAQKPDVGGPEVELQTSAGPIQVKTVAEGLARPWGMDFLPDGRVLVTERPGRLRIVGPDGSLSEPVQGTPEVFSQGQGGLLDVRVHPDFAETGWVYLTFAEPGEGGTASTAVARGKLEGETLTDVEVIFRQEPKVDGGNHFGSRMVFTPDGKLFVGLGERFKFQPAQDLSNHLGTVVRLNADGSVPDDNPFVGRQDAKPEIWSYGHRNIQGGALNPETGEPWFHEHGPRGGDEINIPEAGKNYGWPVVSWGRHYSGDPIPDPPTRPEFADAVFQWTPVIAASGMDFYTGDRFADWQGDLLVGGLVSRSVVRLDVNAREVTEAERLPIGERVRDVQTGPQGDVWVLTDEDNGKLLRLTPAATGQ